MNMIKVNFIPQQSRKSRGDPWQDGLGVIPREELIGILAAAGVFLIFIHLLLAGLALTKLAQYTILEVRWGSLGTEKRVIDKVTNETKSLQARMSALKEITSRQGVSWARVLNAASDSVPKGVWIREMRFEKGLLTIDGSAVSKDKSEMIIVNNFVAALKDQPVMKQGFISLDVDSIERRENTVLSIADFSLKARGEEKKEEKKNVKGAAKKAVK